MAVSLDWFEYLVSLMVVAWLCELVTLVDFHSNYSEHRLTGGGGAVRQLGTGGSANDANSLAGGAGEHFDASRESYCNDAYFDC